MAACGSTCSFAFTAQLCQSTRRDVLPMSKTSNDKKLPEEGFAMSLNVIKTTAIALLSATSIFALSFCGGSDCNCNHIQVCVELVRGNGPDNCELMNECWTWRYLNWDPYLGLTSDCYPDPERRYFSGQRGIVASLPAEMCGLMPRRSCSFQHHAVYGRCCSKPNSNVFSCIEGSLPTVKPAYDCSVAGPVRVKALVYTIKNPDCHG